MDITVLAKYDCRILYHVFNSFAGRLIYKNYISSILDKLRIMKAQKITSNVVFSLGKYTKVFKKRKT